MIKNPNAEKPVFSLGRRKEPAPPSLDVQVNKPEPVLSAGADKLKQEPPKKKKKNAIYERKSWANGIAVMWAMAGPPEDAQSRIRFVMDHPGIVNDGSRAEKTKAEVIKELSGMKEICF